ncbi:MAG: hypothetical protein ACLQVM_15250, partial [Terriglobia bacterium]
PPSLPPQVPSTGCDQTRICSSARNRRKQPSLGHLWDRMRNCWASGEALAPGAAVGDDGNFYFAGSNQILVIAQDGGLLRRVAFDNPDPMSVVTRLHVSGGLIILDLIRIEKHQVHCSYLVFLNSGGVVGYYERSEQLGGWGEMCYSPKQGLTFLKVENRQLKLLIAPLP